MAGPRILLAIIFLIRYISARPTPQGCGPGYCCLRRGAPNLRCEGQSAYDYTSHTRNFDPYDVYNGATIQNIDFPIVMNPGAETVSLGMFVFTLYPDTNQFRTFFDPDVHGK